MSTPDFTPIPERIRALSMAILSTLALMLLSASCSQAAAEQAEPELSEQAVDSVAPVVTAGPDISTTTEIAFEPADERGTHPFAPNSATSECQPKTLIEFLDANPTIAKAWAEASGVEVDEIAATIRSLKPAVLTTPTRVTNHAYRGGIARPFQATLASGTAVLIDDAGVPRVRCACGNPLDEPRSPQAETPKEPVDQQPIAESTPTTTLPVIVGRPDDFCSVWAGLAPLVIGGPVSATEEGVAAYLVTMADGFESLVASAENTDGFPTNGLDDLRAYHSALVIAAASEGAPPSGDPALRDRVEILLTSYCGEAPAEAELDPPTHLDPPVDDPTEESTPTGNCGSMQFFLLVAAADGLGLDHVSVSDEYLDALDDVVAGVDPGPGFDTADLAPMVAYEQVGCAGAQAMQQLFADAGMADLIEGTELGA